MNIRKAGLGSLLVTSLLSLPVQADPGEAYRGTHMWDAGWHGGVHGPFMMMIGFAILLAIIIAVVVVIVRATSRQNPALAILRERFARGEIDMDEFEQRRQALDT